MQRSGQWSAHLAPATQMQSSRSDHITSQGTLTGDAVRDKAAVAGKNLSLSVGYSHGVELAPPPGIEFEAGVDQQSRIPFLIVRGIDKELVGRTAGDPIR